MAMVKVFDLDGTLLDSNGIWRWVDETFLHQHGHKLTDEYNAYVSHAIFPDAAHFTKVYYNLPITEAEIMDGWLALAKSAYAHTLPLKSGAKEYLKQCADRAEQMALYTSSEPSLCRAALQRHGLTAYFSQLLFAQELKLEKKYPDSFSKLSKRLNTQPSECVLYDDSPVACLAAKKAGWTVIGVRDPFFSHQETELEQTCNHVIDNLSELLDS